LIIPLPLLAIAIPVVHSSGAWIASTAASGYLAGTLSGTWIGSFVLGNSSLLGSLGLVSAAGIFGATGGIAAMASGAALGVGSALTAVGLGSVASALGIALAVTFLGLTPVGWAIAGTGAAIAGVVGPTSPAGRCDAISLVGISRRPPSDQVILNITDSLLGIFVDCLSLVGLFQELRSMKNERLLSVGTGTLFEFVTQGQKHLKS
jgi:hypothetical protein